MRNLSQSSPHGKTQSLTGLDLNALDWYPDASLSPHAKDVLAEALVDGRLSRNARELVRALAFLGGTLDVTNTGQLLWLEFVHGLTRSRLRKAARELLHNDVLGYDGSDRGLELVVCTGEVRP